MQRRALIRNTLLLGVAAAVPRGLFAAPASGNRLPAALATLRQRFPDVVANPGTYRLQIEYAYPSRSGWQLEHYRPDAEWIAPASMVKLPMAMFALHRLAQLGLPRSTLLKVIAPPECAAQAAELAQFESLERTLQRMLIVSDNGAYNRLIEFVGGDRLPSLLRRFGFPRAKLQARLGACTPQMNRKGSGVVLADASGTLLFSDQSTPEILVVAPTDGPSTLVGTGYLDFSEQLISEPKDFQFSNHWRLSDAHALTLAMAGAARHPLWDALSVADQQFLTTTLDTLPREAGFSEVQYPDAWGKFLAFGDKTGRYPKSLHCVNKIGEAYGFLLDSAWMRATDIKGRTKQECVLSAVIYVNSDGILNDDQYEYDQIGVPFLAELGRNLLEMSATSSAA